MCIVKQLAHLWEHTLRLKPVPVSLQYVHEKPMRDNLCIAKQFSNTVRYVDDLLTLNNSNFEEEISNMYPPKLTLKMSQTPTCPTWIFQLYMQ